MGIAPGAYRTISTYAQPFMTDGFTDGLSFPYNGINGMTVSTLGNQDLLPEIVTEHEVGLGTKFFDNRLSFDINLYHKTTKDMLINLPLPQSSGFASIYQNAAEVVNKGVEIEFGYDVFKKAALFYGI